MFVKMIGVAMNQGCDIEGTQLATAFLKQQGIEFDDEIAPNIELSGSNEIKHVELIADVCLRLKNSVKNVLLNRDFPLIIGGDHSLAMGSVSANMREDRAVLWIDAHGDVNTPHSSVTKRAHGMPLASLMGYGDPLFLDFIEQPYLLPEQIILFGIHSLDDPEVEFLNKHSIRYITMAEINQKGEQVCIEEVMDHCKRFAHTHISFDLDSIDPAYCPGVSTPVNRGLHPSVPLNLIDQLFKTVSVSSMDIVEFNPLNDNGDSLIILKETLKIVDRKVGEYTYAMNIEE
ncbi:MAG: arginase [Erysipelotrichaceae bacterium]|nr:arginase [Erysipelotrichaceae bacterium]